jgi:Holliday junction resolvase-like predicted endonuclease
MAKAASWIIENQKISKLKESTVGLEENLESWIEQDPSLVQSGLTIVSRQLILENGRLDLLALDPQGRWVIIEVKAGLLDSPVITQALYYVAQIASMEHKSLEAKVDKYLAKNNTELSVLLKERGIEGDQIETRDVYAIVVGTGRTSGLGKLLGFLADKYGFPISAVLFDVFEMPDGRKVLTRELTELDSMPEKLQNKKKSKWTLQEIIKQAKENGIEKEIGIILDAANKHGIFARPFASSIMFTPPQNKARMLFTFWIKPNKDKSLKAFIGSDVFPDFYPISETVSVDLLGKAGWRSMDKNQVKQFLSGLDLLFKE